MVEHLVVKRSLAALDRRATLMLAFMFFSALVSVVFSGPIPAREFRKSFRIEKEDVSTALSRVKRTPGDDNDDGGFGAESSSRDGGLARDSAPGAGVMGNDGGAQGPNFGGQLDAPLSSALADATTTEQEATLMPTQSSRISDRKGMDSVQPGRNRQVIPWVNRSPSSAVDGTQQSTAEYPTTHPWPQPVTPDSQMDITERTESPATEHTQYLTANGQYIEASTHAQSTQMPGHHFLAGPENKVLGYTDPPTPSQDSDQPAAAVRTAMVYPEPSSDQMVVKTSDNAQTSNAERDPPPPPFTLYLLA